MPTMGATVRVIVYKLGALRGDTTQHTLCGGAARRRYWRGQYVRYAPAQATPKKILCVSKPLSCDTKKNTIRDGLPTWQKRRISIPRVTNPRERGRNDCTSPVAVLVVNGSEERRATKGLEVLARHPTSASTETLRKRERKKDATEHSWTTKHTRHTRNEPYVASSQSPPGCFQRAPPWRGWVSPPPTCYVMLGYTMQIRTFAWDSVPSHNRISLSVGTGR